MKIKLVALAVLWMVLLAPTITLAQATDGRVGIGLTPGRLGAIMAGAVGLVSVVIGGLSLAGSAGRFGAGDGRRGAVVAAVVGLIGIVLAGLHLANSTGGFGTGSGRAGAIVAIVVGLLGVTFGGLTLVRSRRAG